MRKLCAFFILILFSTTLFAEDDDEKSKLAVMEFEDRSGNLSNKMLSDATEYIRGAFVASNKFIVIAKERQEKMMIKEMKKESYKSCNDKNCQIPLGQALSADTILRTTINFFGGIYTITSELIDLAKEATVSGAKQNFDGSDKSLMQALDRIAIQIAGTAASYSVEAMETQEIKGVKLGGVELSKMSKIEIKEANFSKVQSNFAVEELESNIGISLDADADVLVLYDKCVMIDKQGKNSPVSAINCWKKLAEVKDNNPFIKQAEKRVSDWQKYTYSKRISELFEKAKNIDTLGQIFPKEVMNAWNYIINYKDKEELSEMFDNPYEDTARERYNFWQKYASQVEKYRSQLKKFEKQRTEDSVKLQKILPLQVINDAQKRTILIQYMEIYAPFYGVEDVTNIIYSMKDKQAAKRIYGLLYNDYLKKEMVEKCNKGNGAACYISASLTEINDPETANKFFQKSCQKGIVNACVKMGETNYNKKNYAEATKYFYEACGMESPDGCHFAAFVTEKGYGVERNIKVAKRIYDKACKLGDKTSCKMDKNLKSDKASSGKKLSAKLSGECFFGYENGCQNDSSNQTDSLPKIDNSQNLTKVPIKTECDALGITPCNDSKNRLIWSTKAKHRMNWNNAVTYCKNLKENGYTWKLPTKDQLKTLMGKGQSKLGDKEWFWSSSSKDSDNAWTVIFTYGVSYSDKDSYGNVRCVITLLDYLK